MCQGRVREHSPGRTADFLCQGRVRGHTPKENGGFLCQGRVRGHSPKVNNGFFISGKSPRALPQGEWWILLLGKNPRMLPRGKVWAFPPALCQPSRSLARQARREKPVWRPSIHKKQAARVADGNGQPVKTALYLGDCPCPCAAHRAFADGSHRASPSTTTPGKVLSRPKSAGNGGF